MMQCMGYAKIMNKKVKTIKYTKKEVTDFLSESNAIECVYSRDALIDAQKAWDYLVKQKVLTKEVILKAHEILMERRPLALKYKGKFRDCPVWIGGREGIKFDKIEKEIDQWVLNVNNIIDEGKNEDKGFLERMTQSHHVAYEKIHGFVDGNGRSGRLLYNWERLQLGLPIHIIYEGEDQYDYYLWFK